MSIVICPRCDDPGSTLETDYICDCGFSIMIVGSDFIAYEMNLGKYHVQWQTGRMNGTWIDFLRDGPPYYSGYKMGCLLPFDITEERLERLLMLI